MFFIRLILFVRVNTITLIDLVSPIMMRTVDADRNFSTGRGGEIVENHKTPSIFQ